MGKKTIRDEMIRKTRKNKKMGNLIKINLKAEIRK